MQPSPATKKTARKTAAAICVPDICLTAATIFVKSCPRKTLQNVSAMTTAKITALTISLRIPF